MCSIFSNEKNPIANLFSNETHHKNHEREQEPTDQPGQAVRYESEHQVCVFVCLCCTMGEFFPSVLLPAPASLTSEARNDSFALHSASPSLPHSTVPLFISIINRPSNNSTFDFF